MTTVQDKNWFTEEYKNYGTALSFKIKSRLHHEKTPYQEIEIYDTEYYGHLMVIDGCVMVTQKDNYLYHEMMSHPVLFTHPNPRNVVIIGGGDCGTLQQVLLHQTVQNVLQVEIDEQVTRLAEKYFPELCTNNDDVRAELYFGDGIAWMREAPDASVDIIIIDSTDPIGPAEGLFGEAFYKQCHRVLDKTGILVQQSESPFFHQKLMQAMQHHMSVAGFPQTQAISFPQPCYPSGWWSATMASKTTKLTQFREQDAKNKTFKTRYYHAAMHQAALIMPAE